ncbi:MAG TPA: flagellar hook-associated protein FlgK [Tepidisphaeraceae bacterium]|nr:flagellar hook-associated protein FlgK [Tepidisphaeraceae bacterium]
MSINGTLNIGKTALAVNQAALQTIGNNIANVGNANYTRQRADLAADKSQKIAKGIFVGTGVELAGIRRQIDEQLEARLRSSISNSEGANETAMWLNRVESVYNELSDQDVSTSMSEYFNAWSELAQKPQDTALRQVVVENAKSLSAQLGTLRQSLGDIAGDANDSLVAATVEADRLIAGIADLNSRIANGGGTANAGLMDQRDTQVKQLSELMNIRTRPREDGTMTIYAGNEPLVEGGVGRGIQVRTDVVNGHTETTVVYKHDGGSVDIKDGKLGALDAVNDQISNTVKQVDDLASSLIFEVNKLHSSGQGLEGYSELSAEHTAADSTAALTSDEADLSFIPKNGSFVVQVKDKSTGAVSSTLISVDLDGLNNNDMSLDDLATALDGVDNISASVVGGRLSVTADSNAVEFNFAQDSSGVLSALGMGGFFTGSSALDIDVSDRVVSNLDLLAASGNGEPADNTTALAINALREKAIDALGGKSLTQAYEANVNEVAASAANATSDAEAGTAIQATLQAQRDAVSGVSLDEEAIQLMQYQRAYQGAARLITTTNEMMQTLMNIV